MYFVFHIWLLLLIAEFYGLVGFDVLKPVRWFNYLL